MALVSPGVEVTVIDESQYISSAVNTVPYFIVATASNKIAASGASIAVGTLEANANKTYLMTSQRELAQTFGVPFFYKTTNGTPINGYELNEYGLLAAYSALAVTNRAYVQRVDIDLAELTASLTRPTGQPNNGDYWLNTANTVWGIQEWNLGTNSFTVKTPLALTNSADVVDAANGNFTPLSSVGNIGDYAVSAMSFYNPGYYKTAGNSAAGVAANTWVLVGSDEWKMSWPTVLGTNNPTSLTAGASIIINDVEVFVPAGPNNTVTGLVAAVNAANINSGGVVAREVSGRLYLYGDSTATNDGSTGSCGVISVETGGSSGAALLTALGITAKEYSTPQYLPSYSYQAPRWASSQTNPAPTGSVWHNMSTVNNGVSMRLAKYSSALGQFVFQNVPTYDNSSDAITALDPTGGGRSIPVGTTIAVWNTQNPGSSCPTFSLEIFERYSLGPTVITGSTNTPGPFVPGSTFQIYATEAGNPAGTGGVVTLAGTSAADFVTAVSAANIPNVSASVNSAGAIVFTHSQGGNIVCVPLAGSPLTLAGFTLSTPYVFPSPVSAGGIVLSNWQTSPEWTYTASSTVPDQDPANGRLWYYSSIDDVDIMIQNNGVWVGYQNCTNDVRGFDLSQTNASGPIIAASAPTTQNDASESPLVFGDLWIDSSDLENFPKLYRWEAVDGVSQWVAVDTTDQVTQNGILFADARWAPNGTTDPVMDPFPTIESLLVSNYLDLDAPSPSLYPQGMLLFNTRRSGYNVKRFAVNYFNANSFPDDTLPAQTNTWVTASGNRNDGAMWAGRQAQRQLVVQAMKAGIDTSLAAREEQTAFTLLAAPGYPELMINMVALSNERNNTVFVVGDTPLRLPGNATDIAAWATNNNSTGFITGDGLNTGSQYMGVFYPSCQTTDLGGSRVVQPPSHMMVRTIIRSDAVSYPWFAPAGTRRGVVDNALAIGYVDGQTGEFVQLNVGQGLRDVLYTNDINPITFVPGTGIVNFGNKTVTSIDSALDRINVSRLVSFLRERLTQIGKLYLFEPNDEITRREITNTINSLMIDLVAKRGIYDYFVQCDLTNNTPERIDRNELWVDIAIEPVKAIEFIYIPLRIKNTGEISGQPA